MNKKSIVDIIVCKKCGSKNKVIFEKMGTNGSYIYRDRNNKRVVGTTCNLCFLKKQTETRRKKGNKATHKYEKTMNGFLMRSYRNMKSRISGIQYKKAHLYFGKSLLPKEDFYAWAKSSEEFLSLFKEWEKMGYDRKFCPTPDRIDPNEGYELWNMRWVTHSFNSRNTRRHSDKLFITHGMKDRLKS